MPTGMCARAMLTLASTVGGEAAPMSSAESAFTQTPQAVEATPGAAYERRPPVSASVAGSSPPTAQLQLRSFGTRGGGGLTHLGVRECADDLALGFFYAGAPGAFEAVSSARQHAERAHVARQLGFGFWAAGLAMLAGDIVYALAAGDSLRYSGTSGAVFFSLLGGSFVTGLVAHAQLRQADGELAEATRLWNEEAFARATGHRSCP